MGIINNKKIIIGVGLLLIVLTVLAVTFYFVKTKNLASRQNQEVSSLSEGEKSELNKEKIISERKYMVAKEDCVAAKQEFKDGCLNLASVNEALENSDYKICDGLKNDWKDICIWKLTGSLTAQGFEQEKKCAEIKDEGTKDNCYLVAAVNLNQEKICNSCQYNKDECLDSVKERNSNKLSDCAGIKQDGIYKVCINNKNEDCATLGDKEIIDRCQAWRIYDEVIAGGKKEECTRFSIEKFKKVCEIYFDQGYIDSDDDGANNYEELLLGTDPFAFDKNAIELKNGGSQQQTIIKNYYSTLNNLYDVMSSIVEKEQPAPIAATSTEN